MMGKGRGKGKIDTPERGECCKSVERRCYVFVWRGKRGSGEAYEYARFSLTRQRGSSIFHPISWNGKYAPDNEIAVIIRHAFCAPFGSSYGRET